MENKRLKQKIATCLINEDLNFFEEFAEKGWFSAGIRLTRQQVIQGLVNFMLEMLAPGETTLSKQELKRRILKKIREVSYNERSS